MQGLGSCASVVAAIREDAAAEADRIEEESAIEIEAIRKGSASANVTISDRDARLAAARAENEERFARQEWEGRRAMIEQREAWMDRVTAEARKQWRTDGAQLAALILEALHEINAPEVEIAVAARDRAAVDPSKLGKSIRVTTAEIEGGCIAAAGDLVFDNSLEARARRLEPIWRKALSELYRPGPEGTP